MCADQRTTVVQISNISPSASRDQLYHMFSYLGRIHEFKMYPSEVNPVSAFSQSKICYIRYEKAHSVATAQHVTNMVFVDRALIVVPITDGEIPDEDTALRLGGPSLPGQRQLPAGVVNEIKTIGKRQALVTYDPKLTALSLPPYPPLPPHMEGHKVEEIRRTVYVSDLPSDTDSEDLMRFLTKNVGEVMYLRMAISGDSPTKFAYVEFSNQLSVPVALQNNNIEYRGTNLKFHHSTVAIVKPKASELEKAARNSENSTVNSSDRVANSGDEQRSSKRRNSKSKRRSRSRSSKRHSSKSKSKKHRSRSRRKRKRSHSSTSRHKDSSRKSRSRSSRHRN